MVHRKGREKRGITVICKNELPWYSVSFFVQNPDKCAIIYQHNDLTKKGKQGYKNKKGKKVKNHGTLDSGRRFAYLYYCGNYIGGNFRSVGSGGERG